MLLDPGLGRRSGPVAVRTWEPAFRRLLESILREWRYPTEPGPGDPVVAVVEHGLAAPEGVLHTLWLSPLPLDPESLFAMPLSLSALYRTLQTWFYPTPRRYLRLAVDLPVQVELHGGCRNGRLISLSERGGRIVCSASLPKGELLQLEVSLGGYLLEAAAEVIYDIPAGDVPGSNAHQFGLMFSRLPPELCLALHRHIERTHLERACAQAGIALDDPLLHRFDTMGDPWAGLPG